MWHPELEKAGLENILDSYMTLLANRDTPFHRRCVELYLAEVKELCSYQCYVYCKMIYEGIINETISTPKMPRL